MMVKFIHWIYIILGSFFLFLGILGIFLPLLPTTPFLLLTAYFFDKGSPRFHRWILKHPVLGPPIHDWQNHKMISKKNKAIAILLIAITSIFVLAQNKIPPLGKYSYTVVIFFVVFFILSRRSQK